MGLAGPRVDLDTTGERDSSEGHPHAETPDPLSGWLRRPVRLAESETPTLHLHRHTLAVIHYGEFANNPERALTERLLVALVLDPDVACATLDRVVDELAHAAVDVILGVTERFHHPIETDKRE